jgi:hypothetical protein
MQAGEKVPERPRPDAPAIWLIRNDATARRLRRRDGSLRTIVGYETLLSRRLESIEIAEVTEVEVVAPYAPPRPQLALIIFGLSLGMILGSQFNAASALIIAVTTVTFGIVASIVGRTMTPGHRLARLRTGGRTQMVSYRLEDEPRIQALFSTANWIDTNTTDDQARLSPEEEKQADKIRIGTTLIASAVALAMLVYAIDTDSDVSDAVAIPVNIFYLAVLGLTLIFAAISWYKMTRLGMRK